MFQECVCVCACIYINICILYIYIYKVCKYFLTAKINGCYLSYRCLKERGEKEKRKG